MKPTKRLQRGSLAVGMLALAGAWGGCTNVYLDPVGMPGAASFAVDSVPNGAVDKVDLVLVVDNSRSMADKEQLLHLAVPDLMSSLVNPRCLDLEGHALPPEQQPTNPLASCPGGSRRAFKPVLDMHVGVITSSLGDHGGDVCPDGMPGMDNNDQGHLITRGVGGTTVPTYQELGFLAWDPNQVMSPAGESDVQTLVADTTALVLGAGEVGCGMESQLESWYRFLVDPDPYQSVEPDQQGLDAVLSGLDTALLAERKAFLRPDSLLLILMLTDENDCSIRDGGQYFFVARSNNYHLPAATAECAVDPNDPCCRSCGSAVPDGCAPNGPECEANLDGLADPINLRCFDQKRRFGIDFLQPIDRYVTGITSPQVPNRNGELAPNPVFSDLRDPGGAPVTVRDPSLVVLAGIVGVPWQDIARKGSGGTPDLVAGLDHAGYPSGGFQSAAELEASGTWDVILGEPAYYHTDPNAQPTDAHMLQSIDPRPGLPAPDSGYMTDPIGGHEYTATANRDDLQYACTFELDTPRDCAAAASSCDCQAGASDTNPLCQAPDGSYGTTQYRAKSYPGIRPLQVLRSLGTQGAVGSVCPAQQLDAQGRDYGYRPAVGAALERVTGALGNRCMKLETPPAVGADGSIACRVIEARVSADACACDGARLAIDADLQPAVDAIVANGTPEPWSCFCEIPQSTGPALVACQYDASAAPTVEDTPVSGWCYVDASSWPTVGNAELVSTCPAGLQRTVRFLGAAEPESGANVFLACAQ